MRCWLLLLFFALLFAACDSNRVYEKDQEFSDRTWKTSDTSAFEFTIRDTGKKYNLFYRVRNSLDYPYARIFVQYSLRDSSGNENQKKLVSAFLFDQKTGQPFGDSGLGDVYDHQFPLLHNFEFKKPGLYKLRLAQFMRTDTLKGILAAGIRVETVEEKK